MKKIKVSYSILVIIMFAVICFITDYIIIDGKLKNNKTINGNDINISYEYFTGCYKGYPIDIDNDKQIASLSLYSDGTYSFGWAPGLRTIGNYIITDKEIKMNDLFSVGSDPTMKILDSSRILYIGEENILYDNDMIINTDSNNYKGLKLIKNSECSTENKFDSAMKNLQKYYMEKVIEEESTTINQQTNNSYSYIGTLINIPQFYKFENLVNDEINISIVEGNIVLKMNDKTVKLQTLNARELYWYAYHDGGLYYLVYITNDNVLKKFESDVLSIINNGASNTSIVTDNISNFIEIDNESTGNGKNIGMYKNDSNYNFYYLVKNKIGDTQKIVFDTYNN